MATLNALARSIGSQPGVISGLAAKVLAAAGGLVTAILIGYTFTPELQGYHYAFLSLLGLQIVVELGLSTVISVFASHEWSRLRINGRGELEGDEVALSRLANIFRFGVAWFGVGALCLGAGLALFGLLFFSRSPERAADVAWQAPWLFLCGTAAVGLALTPAWAVLLGCNQVAAINRYRLVEIALRSICLWLLLVAGAGLWSAPVASIAVLPWSLGFLYRRYGAFFRSLFRQPFASRVDWRREMLPMQWRIAVSWLAGYFSFSLFVPALFWYRGPVVAGQMGMTWALVSGVSGLAATWIQVKTPQFAMLVARKEFVALDQLVRETAAVSVAAATAGGIALLGVLWVLDAIAPELRLRLLPLLPIAVLLAAEALHQISMAQSTYLRAFKREPFFGVSMASAVIIGGGTVLSAKFFGASGVAFCYFGAIVLALVWGTRILQQRRREWARA